MDKKEIISRLLRKHPEGLTTVDIARELSFARNTVSIALAELRGADLIWVRPVGIARLHYWKESKR